MNNWQEGLGKKSARVSEIRAVSYITKRETVSDLDFPVLGFTVTVTLHVPALSPLIDEPLTLQNFVVDRSTFIEILEPLVTFNVVKAAIALADLLDVLDN